MAKNISTITAEVYDILEPLQSDERKRVLQAALALLGEPSAVIVGSGGLGSTGDGPDDANKMPVKAKLWMTQNALTTMQMEQAFHFGADSVEVIVSTVPGTTNNERCRNSYLLVGTAQLLSTGEPNFTDDAARAQCTKAGSYDATNHSKFIKVMGNEFAGNKSKGWTLTGPGLKAAAALVKELSSSVQ